MKDGFGSSLFSFFYASPAFVPFVAGMSIFLLLCISLNGLTKRHTACCQVILNLLSWVALL